jgi:hypothetical protein
VRLILKRCFSCGALGIGLWAVKLWHFESRMYCREHYRDALTWHESRGNISLALQIEDANVREAARRVRETGYLTKVVRQPKIQWLWYLHDLCALAEFGLLHGDRKTFVYYFARAVYAWELKETR